MRLLEGSEVRVNCSECGQHEWIVTVLEGKQTLRCPECRQQTIVEFNKNRDDSFEMRTR